MKITCGCEYPDIYSRETFVGDTLQKAVACCRNCGATWIWDMEFKRWIGTKMNNNQTGSR